MDQGSEGNDGKRRGIRLQNLPASFRRGVLADRDRLPGEFLYGQEGTISIGAVPYDVSSDFKTARAEFEARFLESKLQECQGNITRLAEVVGLERSYLYRKLKAYGIFVTE